MGKRRRGSRTRQPPKPRELGWRLVCQHPLFGPLASMSHPVHDPDAVGSQGWMVLDPLGRMHIDPDRSGTAEEWAWIYAYGLLQLGLGHLPVRRPAAAWVAAAAVATQRLLRDIKIGRRPDSVHSAPELTPRDAPSLFRRFQATGVPPGLLELGVGGQGRWDLMDRQPDRHEARDLEARLRRAERSLALGLTRAVRSAVDLAGGVTSELGGHRQTSAATDAMRWFVSSFPLLGALASSFELEEDLDRCRALDIQIAAVDPEQQKIYVNPTAGLDLEETRFVLAHEMLHAGLRHETRRQGRDPYLWNVACDYVINGWLVEMEIGRLPDRGVLYDPALKDLSAETVYERITRDLRRLRKLSTLRGRGLGDILGGEIAWWHGSGCDLDAFYRRALATGLQLCEASGRGFLPAGLVQEIQALAHPPIPWDVELAQWFDRYFAPLERRRTYARPSRRQSSTPDIPRPRYVLQEDAIAGRTFGVVLDTSGSMNAQLLGRALGAIASYAASRDVPAARVVFCDAAPYDQGYMPVDDIARRVRVRGRGGTVLQPGIDLLERAEDFPRDGPLLIITDAGCDVLKIKRDHAFLIPEGRRLPFIPRGPTFRIC